MSNEPLPAVQDALTRMRRAYERGTGCYLTRGMIEGLQCSCVGQMWEEEDPRNAKEEKP